MADERLKHDANHFPVVGGLTDDANLDITAIRVNPTTKRLLTESTAGSSSSIGTGTISVLLSGGTIQLSVASVGCSRVWVQALDTNSDLVSVGDKYVSAGTPTSSNRRGVVLYPTQGQFFSVSNLNMLYVASAANNGVVHYYYEI
jgi:hypothetical protein